MAIYERALETEVYEDNGIWISQTNDDRSREAIVLSLHQAEWVVQELNKLLKGK